MTKHLPEGHAPPPGRTRKRPEPTRGDGQPRHPPHRDQLPKPTPSLAWSELARKAQFRVSAMARLQGTTRRTLLRRSQRDHGCSLAEARKALRIERAKRLLEQGVPAKELAAGMGFKHPSTFSRFFKLQTGLSLRAYLARNGLRRRQDVPDQALHSI